MIEYFDIVDERDRPSGRKATREEAHAQQLPHRCVAVYVFDPNGHLYLQVHEKSGGLLDHSVGGHVSAGEDYLSAARREAEEELGLIGAELGEVALGLHSPEHSCVHIFGVYECHPTETWQFAPNAEVKQLTLRPLDEIVSDMNTNPRNYTPGFINTMQAYIAAKELPYQLEVNGKLWGRVE